MSNTESVLNPTSMIDYDLYRAWDGATVGVTVYNGDDSDLDNLIHQGYTVVGVVTVL